MSIVVDVGWWEGVTKGAGQTETGGEDGDEDGDGEYVVTGVYLL